MSELLVHGTALAIDGDAVLITGPSGSGKSDLALRLIDRGAILVSDDAVRVTAPDGRPTVGSAPNIEGRLELRGVGIIKLPHLASAPLRLVVRLVDYYDRLPDDGVRADIGGFAFPAAALHAFENSAVLKVEFALRQIIEDGRWPQHVADMSPTESPVP